MPYLIPLFLIILGFIRPKDKWVTLLFLVYMWALVGLNTFTPDWESYEEKYETFLLLKDYEIGHQGLILGCNYLGLSYQEFRMVYGFLMSIFAGIAVRRLSPYPNYLLAFFLIWPFVGNVSGIRQGLANVIVCCGIPCLFREGKKHIIYYLLWIALAWSIHQSSLFYLVLLFSRMEYGKREKRVVIITALVGLFLISSAQIFNGIPFIADNHKLNKWLNLSADEGADHQNIAGFLIRSFFVCCYAYVVPRLARIIETHTILTEKEKRRIRTISNISVLMILTIPGYVVSGEYQRFLYAMLLAYYAVFADFRFRRFQKPFQQRGVLLATCFGLLLLTAGYYMFSMTSHDILATFRDNLLFK